LHVHLASFACCGIQPPRVHGGSPIADANRVPYGRHLRGSLAGREARSNAAAPMPTCRHPAEMAAPGGKGPSSPLRFDAKRKDSESWASNQFAAWAANISASAGMSSYVVRHRERNSRREPRCDAGLPAVPSPEAACIVVACSVRSCPALHDIGCPAFHDVGMVG